MTSGLWIDPNGRAIKVNSSDQALFEWLLVLRRAGDHHGENPFFTHLIGFPDGANLAVNTSITVYAVRVRAADLPGRAPRSRSW